MSKWKQPGAEASKKPLENHADRVDYVKAILDPAYFEFSMKLMTTMMQDKMIAPADMIVAMTMIGTKAFDHAAVMEKLLSGKCEGTRACLTGLAEHIKENHG